MHTNDNYNSCVDSIEKLKKQFIQFAMDVAGLVTRLPANSVNFVYGNQVIRYSNYTSTNYRATGRVNYQADFICKLKTVKEAAEESVSFLELLLFFNKEYKNDFDSLINEGNELLSITVSSIKNCKRLIFQ